MLEDISKIKLHPGFRAWHRPWDGQIDLLFENKYIVASFRYACGWSPLVYESAYSIGGPDLCLLTEDCIDILNEFILIQHIAQLSYRDNHGKISTGVNCSRLT